jgi:hypothetical protein
MSRFIAQLVTGAISILGLIHVYWAFGCRAASKAAVPEIDGHRAFSPSRLAIIAVAVALFSTAALVAVAGRLIANPFPPSCIRRFASLSALVFCSLPSIMSDEGSKRPLTVQLR